MLRRFREVEEAVSRRTVRQGKGKWLFTIPEVPKQVIVPWILSQRGEATPIEPPEIVAAVREAATAILKKMEKIHER